jgi:hypothetical protein
MTILVTAVTSLYHATTNVAVVTCGIVVAIRPSYHVINFSPPMCF